jgi:hypothetical protein
MEASGQLHAPAALPMEKEPLVYPLERRLSRSQSRAKPCGVEINSLHLPEIEPQLFRPVTRHYTD